MALFLELHVTTNVIWHSLYKDSLQSFFRLPFTIHRKKKLLKNVGLPKFHPPAQPITATNKYI